MIIDLLVKLHWHYQHTVYVSDSHHAYQWQQLEVTVYNNNISSIHVHCHIRMTLMTKYQRNSSNKERESVNQYLSFNYDPSKED